MDNKNQNYFYDRCNCNDKKQTHDHEIQGSVQIAEPQEDPHNHRFATVSGKAIPAGTSHFHEVKFRTDFYENHYHEFCGKTSLAIPVGDRHVHFLESVTDVSDGHFHEFRVATLIDDPIGEEA
nr:YmaF family protein [uncultured Clostridium sp.]